MSKYVIAWPQNYRSIKWLYFAEVDTSSNFAPECNAYAAPSGTKIIMRSALIAEAKVFEDRNAALNALRMDIGVDNTAQIKELTEEDIERGKREVFNMKLGNIHGTDS